MSGLEEWPTFFFLLLNRMKEIYCLTVHGAKLPLNLNHFACVRIDQWETCTENRQKTTWEPFNEPTNQRDSKLQGTWEKIIRQVMGLHRRKERKKERKKRIPQMGLRYRALFLMSSYCSPLLSGVVYGIFIFFWMPTSLSNKWEGK